MRLPEQRNATAFRDDNVVEDHLRDYCDLGRYAIAQPQVRRVSVDARAFRDARLGPSFGPMYGETLC